MGGCVGAAEWLLVFLAAGTARAGMAPTAAPSAPRFAPLLAGVARTPDLLAALGEHPAAEALRDFSLVDPGSALGAARFDRWSLALEALQESGAWRPQDGAPLEADSAAILIRAFDEAQRLAQAELARLEGDAEAALGRSLELSRENPRAVQDPAAFFAYARLLEEFAAGAAPYLGPGRLERLRALGEEFAAKGGQAMRLLERGGIREEAAALSLARARALARRLGLAGMRVAESPEEPQPASTAREFWLPAERDRGLLPGVMSLRPARQEADAAALAPPNPFQNNPAGPLAAWWGDLVVAPAMLAPAFLGIGPLQLPLNPALAPAAGAALAPAPEIIAAPAQPPAEAGGQEPGGPAQVPPGPTWSARAAAAVQAGWRWLRESAAFLGAGLWRVTHRYVVSPPLSLGRILARAAWAGLGALRDAWDDRGLWPAPLERRIARWQVRYQSLIEELGAAWEAERFAFVGDPGSRAPRRRRERAVRALSRAGRLLERDPMVADAVLDGLRAPLIALFSGLHSLEFDIEARGGLFVLYAQWARHFERADGSPLAWREMAPDDPLWPLRAALAFTYGMGEAPPAAPYTAAAAELRLRAVGFPEEDLAAALALAPIQEPRWRGYFRTLSSWNLERFLDRGLGGALELAQAVFELRAHESALQRARNPEEAAAALAELDSSVRALSGTELGRRLLREAWADPEPLLGLLRLLGSPDAAVRARAEAVLESLSGELERQLPASLGAAAARRFARRPERGLERRTEAALEAAARSAEGRAALAGLAFFHLFRNPANMVPEAAYRLALAVVAALGERAAESVPLDAVDWLLAEEAAVRALPREHWGTLQAALGELVAALRGHGVLRLAAERALARLGAPDVEPDSAQAGARLRLADLLLREAPARRVQAASWERAAEAAIRGRPEDRARARGLAAALGRGLAEMDAAAFGRVATLLLEGAAAEVGTPEADLWAESALAIVRGQQLGPNLEESLPALVRAVGAGDGEAVDRLLADVDFFLRARFGNVRVGRALDARLRARRGPDGVPRVAP